MKCPDCSDGAWYRFMGEIVYCLGCHHADGTPREEYFEWKPPIGGEKGG